MPSVPPLLPAPLFAAAQGLRLHLRGDRADLHHRGDDVLAALCGMLPGVQAATLAVRDGPQFKVQALHGYPHSLRGLHLPVFTERVWYGQGDEVWRRGVPRTLTGEALRTHVHAVTQTFGAQAHLDTLRTDARLDDLAWNVLVPLALDGQVRAHLNLDGFAADRGPPEWPAELTAWLSGMLEEVWLARPGAPTLAEENRALRVIAHLGDVLRPLNDPQRILAVGLQETASGFGAADAFIVDGSELRCLARGHVLPAPPEPETWDGWFDLGYGGAAVICELCDDGRRIGVVWTECPPALHLARTALRGVADRVHLATSRAQEEARRRAAAQHALALVGVVLEARDLETAGHTHRVAALARQLGATLQLSAPELEALHVGALLHDLGKVALPDHVLLKPGPLDEHEWQWIRRHPQLGFDLAAHVPGLPRDVLDVILHHHERWDGQGYPAGLAAEGIPRLARLFSVVDSYDALTSVRPYKAPWSDADARTELQRQSGRQFDPAVVEAFLTMPPAPDSLAI